MCRIKVAIIEDDPVWLALLSDFLNNEGDLTVEDTASNREQALEMVKNTETDVILMDINLTENNYDGIYIAAEISQRIKTKIIMLTSLEDEEVVTNSFVAGAVNYISKSNYKEIPSAIRNVHNKCSPIEILLKDYSRMKEEEQLALLTPSEKEILSFIEKGYTQSKIADKLFKSQGTLKCQVNKILKKMSVSNCKEAIKKVKSKGLLK